MMNRQGSSAFTVLLKQYVERHKIVFKVMQIYHPEKLIYHWVNWEDDNEVADFYNILKFATSEPDRGRWGNWNYYFHGQECELVHIDTGEPITWGARSIYTFDFYWFFTYFEWFMDKNFESDIAKTLKESFLDSNTNYEVYFNKLMRQLLADKIIFLIKDNLYELSHYKPI